MQGSNTGSFVKVAKKQRRFDDGVSKQGNAKKGKFNKDFKSQRDSWDGRASGDGKN